MIIKTSLKRTSVPAEGPGKSLRGRKAETEKGDRREYLEQSEKVTFHGKEEEMVRGR